MVFHNLILWAVQEYSKNFDRRFKCGVRACVPDVKNLLNVLSFMLDLYRLYATFGFC